MGHYMTTLARMAHSCANLYGKIGRMLFVLIDGNFDPETSKFIDQ